LPLSAPRRRFPTPLQAVVLTLAGFAMMFFGCLGALTTYDTSDVMFGILLVVSIAGALALAVGVVIIMVMFVKGVVKAFQDRRQQPPPSPPVAPVRKTE
jgi:ABC-type nickel/cobalt efflux system permease component RcnA